GWRDGLDWFGHWTRRVAGCILIETDRRGEAMQRGPRSFDPVRLGQRECAAWAAYYRNQWGRGMLSSVGLVRTGFGMGWPRTLLGAWYMLRAIRAWAPYPDNDPDAARAYMRRF